MEIASELGSLFEVLVGDVEAETGVDRGVVVWWFIRMRTLRLPWLS